MPILVTCKFEEDPIKTEGAVESTIFLWCSRVGNSEVNTKMNVTRIRTLWDFMYVLFICKFDDDTIKGTENKVYCLIWPKIELVQDDLNLYIRGKKSLGYLGLLCYIYEPVRNSKCNKKIKFV